MSVLGPTWAYPMLIWETMLPVCVTMCVRCSSIRAPRALGDTFACLWLVWAAMPTSCTWTNVSWRLWFRLILCPRDERNSCSMVLVSMRSFVNEDGRICTCAGGMEPSSVSSVRLRPSSCAFVHLASVCFHVSSSSTTLSLASDVLVRLLHPLHGCEQTCLIRPRGRVPSRNGLHRTDGPACLPSARSIRVRTARSSSMCVARMSVFDFTFKSEERPRRRHSPSRASKTTVFVHLVRARPFRSMLLDEAPASPYSAFDPNQADPVLVSRRSNPPVRFSHLRDTRSRLPSPSPSPSSSHEILA
mmetsp:Transcript_9885/g.60265  ORF Transcript_9885/g.60265 Transcript_9885/m.60265 type:complete len:302 (+) Transcript_9885:2224-3129(+)